MSVPTLRVSLYKRSIGVYYIGCYHDHRRRWNALVRQPRNEGGPAIQVFRGGCCSAPSRDRRVSLELLNLIHRARYAYLRPYYLS